MKLKIYRIDDPIYGASLTLCVGDLKLFEKYLKKFDFYNQIELSKTGIGKHIFLEGYNIIWIKKFNLGTLFHEISHMVFSVFNSRGIPIDIQNDEVFAYYVQMTTNNILRKFKVKTS